jgi:uncharacterized protein (TIGR03435 family)
MCRAIAALFAIAGTALFAQPVEFEVASVRPHAAGVPASYPPTGGVGTDDPERIAYNGFSLRALLLAAFDLNHSYRIPGPEWLDRGLYDVSAKIPAGTTKEQFRLMLQRLLVERFRITLHWEMREVPAYGLVVGKNGPKIKVSGSNSPTTGGTPEETAKNECSKLHLGKGPDVQVSVSPRGVCLAASEQPIGKLADFLDGTLERPVADKTGLTGKYDFTLFYSVDGTFMDRTIRPDSEGAPYVITAVQEQLGLKLEPDKTRIDILVIDRANKTPTEN